jgi:hypothetical protein
MGGFSKGGSPIETETARIISPMEKLGKRANGHSVFQQGVIVVSYLVSPAWGSAA